MNELRDLDARATTLTLPMVAGVSRAELRLATPCTDWDLGELVEHMTVQHRMFAAAARAADGDATTRVAHPAGRDGDAAAYHAACGEVLEAFAELPADAELRLPEVIAQPLPARLALQFHLVDNVVHAWDVAVSRYRMLDIDGELLDTAVRVASRVPDGPARTEPGAAFGPRRPVPEGATDLDRLLLLLGRTPGWTPGPFPRH